MKTKELAEEVTEYQVGDGQNGNILSEKKNGQEAGKEKESYGRKFLVFLSFIEVFYGFEEKDVNSFGDQTD